MKWQIKHSFLGTEFDWIARDSNGLLGYFSTAGFGGIPTSAVEIGDEMYAICDLLLGLPERGLEKVVSDRTNREDWARVSRRGFFAYDWNRRSALYERISLPSSPLFLVDLERQSRLRGALEASLLEGDFSQRESVQPK